MLQSFQTNNLPPSLQVRALAELELRRRRLEAQKKPTYDEWLKIVSPTFEWDWKHLIYIRKYINKLLNNEIPNLILAMPPRHGKSEMVTVRLPAWLLEYKPEKRVIVGSYNQTLAEKFSRKTRRIVQSRIEISSERKSVSEWETLEGGGYRAAGVGSGVTGMGGDLIIIDDPVKSREDANSAAFQEKTWNWYTDDLYTRREPGAKMILIMTRWHELDLAGRILSSDHANEWTLVNLPALAETNDPLGRLEGEALCPERYDVEALLKIKNVMGASFQSLYQQRPSALEGEIFKREYWKYYREAPWFDIIGQSWDTSFKDGEENDYSVCTTWGIANNGYYLLHRFKEKLQFPELKRAFITLAAKFNPSYILVEDKASGQSLVQEMQRETRLPVIPFKVDRDKVARANAVTPTIEAGKVYLPENEAWVFDYIDELAVFPNGAHDDEVDSTTQFLLYQNQRKEFVFDSIPSITQKINTSLCMG